jgi:hypothetical protein
LARFGLIINLDSNIVPNLIAWDQNLAVVHADTCDSCGEQLAVFGGERWRNKHRTEATFFSKARKETSDIGIRFGCE